jgi:DNA-binding response OmpR family regulator
MLSAVKRMLTVMGYEVLTASTASEARQVAAERAGSIDLLISDVVMPGINGRELSVQLLSLSPGMRVLFMSGYTPDVTARYGLSEIGADFIQKPFTARELAQRVRGLLSRPSAA